MNTAELNRFTGTENYYKHYTGLVYTDGIKYLAEHAGAYWLIDAIASYRRQEPFQVWTLSDSGGPKGWLLTMQEDADLPFLVKQWIEYSDFPLDSITVWVVNGVLILKSEY